MPDNQNKDNNPGQSDENQNQASGAENSAGQSESQGTGTQRQQSPGGIDFTNPKTPLGDEDPSKGQVGQPGLNDPDKGEWSPTTRHSER